MFNRKRLAVPSVLLAASVLFFSAGVPAYAGDVSGSEAASVETTKEASTAAPVQETKKAEEVPLAPAKEEPVAPAAPVAPVVPDPVVVAPAPPVEPAPAPAAPEPAAPAAPVVPQVETPVAPELPAAPEKDVVIDDPAPVVVSPSAEEEIPPACEPSWTVQVDTVFDPEILPGWGTLFVNGNVECGTPGASYGDYTVVITNAAFYPEGGTVGYIGGLKTTSGTYFDGTNLFWSCAREGASYSLVDNTTGLSVTGVVPLPGGVDAGDSRCGATTPVQETKVVTLPGLDIVYAGENQAGSITPKAPVTGATFVVTPAGAIQGEVEWKWVLDPETPETKYVFAEGSVISGTVNLGEYSESVPNPGTAHEYAGGGVEFGGKNSEASLIPFEGPFSQREFAFVEVKGTTHDGSPVTVSGKLQEVLGGVTIKEALDLSMLCGKATWTWYAKADTDSESPKWIIVAGFLGGLPACDPQGGDDGDDSENPNPNPNPNPWNPGHGHGNGNGNGHGHNGGHHNNGGWWNGHTWEPGNNGPVGTPGDLSNNVTDSSVNPFIVQAASSEPLGLGNAYPDASEWPSGSSSETEDLAYTGFNAQSIAGIILGLLVLGGILVVLSRRHGRSAV